MLLDHWSSASPYAVPHLPVCSGDDQCSDDAVDTQRRTSLCSSGMKWVFVHSRMGERIRDECSARIVHRSSPKTREMILDIECIAADVWVPQHVWMIRQAAVGQLVKSNWLEYCSPGVFGRFVVL